MDLGKEYGPLPLGAWFAVIGGGLGIAIWSRQRGNTGTTVVEDTRAQVGVGEGFDAYIPAVNATPSLPKEKEPVDNEEWGRKAINTLIALNYDPALADSAIRKYLATEVLTAAEYALVRIALRELGAPPIPLPPPQEPAPTVKPVVVTPPKPAPPPPPPPPPPPRPAIRIHVVTPWPSKGSTLWGIAQIYYGNGNLYRRIWDANRKGVVRPDGSPGFISDPRGWVYPGDRIYVP